MPTLGPRPVPLPPERLDALPADDPAARAGRRDLSLIDRLMGNHRWLARQIAQSSTTGPLLELGAGDAQHLRAYGRLPGVNITGLDLAPRPSDWPTDWDWLQGDFFRNDWPPAQTIFGSLILHHLEAAALQTLGQRLQSSSRLLFVEPARRRRHLAQGVLLGPLLHPLTRHDLALSVRAGFLPGELGPALGLNPQHWQINEQLHPLGGLRFEARKL